jgi:DNA-binding response OmpR family regulator
VIAPDLHRRHAAVTRVGSDLDGMTYESGLQLDLPPLALAPANILVVDDDADLRTLVRLTLTGAGYQVTTASNGENALATIERRVPDLLVLDVMMPTMSGIQVCRQLRATRRTRLLPILMLTARVQVMFEGEGYLAGADYYMPKPFSPRALVAKVEELLL